MQLSGMPPFKQGIIFGLGLTVIEMTIFLTNSFANTSTDSAGISLILASIGFIIGLAAYFVAGIFGAKEGGKIGTGSIVGLVTGFTYGVVGLAVSISVFFSVTFPIARQAAGVTDEVMVALAVGGVGVFILGLLFAGGLGAGLGALGGLVGKNMYKKPEAQRQPVGLGYPPPMANPYEAGPYQPQPGPYVEYPNQNPYENRPTY